jgi:hypothetical protein
VINPKAKLHMDMLVSMDNGCAHFFLIFTFIRTVDRCGSKGP